MQRRSKALPKGGVHLNIVGESGKRHDLQRTVIERCLNRNGGSMLNSR